MLFCHNFLRSFLLCLRHGVLSSFPPQCPSLFAACCSVIIYFCEQRNKNKCHIFLKTNENQKPGDQT
jgi:hypothetical protein